MEELQNKLNIRMYTWLAGGLSWAYVMARIGQAFENIGHNVYPLSTNGLSSSDPYFSERKMLESTIALQKFGPGKKNINIDLTYTVPINFPKRFLSNSKHKCTIYNYETWAPGGGWPNEWKKFYHLVDYYFPSSNFSAEIFHINGVPKEKIFVIPHGVDTSVFNKNIKKINLKTKKKFKFVSIVAPHFRKNIDALLHAYCQAFTNKDDVCLVLKTKVYKHSDGLYDAVKNPNGRKAFEVVIGDIFKDISNKYGSKMPEIELISGHVDNVASIYNACDCHITTTGAEGFFMPGLEAMSCGLINIASNYSGHLDFLNENNSLLIDTELREAKPVEQYWSYTSGSKIGQPNNDHTIELMRKVVRDKDSLSLKFKPEMDRVVKEFSWENAAIKIVNACNGTMSSYVPGTYNLFGNKIK